jgi:Flp pilus assembly pilin Flp
MGLSMMNRHRLEQRRRPANTGQSLSEYALLLGLITLFCLGALSLLGNNLSNFFNGFGHQVQSIPTSAP